MNRITVVVAIVAIADAMTTTVYTEKVHAKKHTECFKTGESDGRAHNAFDAALFQSCGKNYQGGYVEGCASARQRQT